MVYTCHFANFTWRIYLKYGRFYYKLMLQNFISCDVSSKTIDDCTAIVRSGNSRLRITTKTGKFEACKVYVYHFYSGCKIVPNTSEIFTQTVASTCYGTFHKTASKRTVCVYLCVRT